MKSVPNRAPKRRTKPPPRGKLNNGKSRSKASEPLTTDLSAESTDSETANTWDGRELRIGLLAAVIVIASLSAVLMSACSADVERSFAPAPDPETRHEVVIRPAETASISSGLSDINSDPIGIRCATCHRARSASGPSPRIDHTETFHLEISLQHGQLSCQSCHGDGDRDTLRLADATPVAFEDVVQLCGQCHGPQHRDYRHGSHGGMTGYWDLSRGPRERNNCVHCHNAHLPNYGVFHPAMGPRDRFLNTNTAADSHDNQPFGTTSSDFEAN